MTDQFDRTALVRPAFRPSQGFERTNPYGQLSAPTGPQTDSRERAMVRDLFAGIGTDLEAGEGCAASPALPHPDFEARTKIWRDQAAGLISMAEAQRLSAKIGALTLKPNRAMGRVAGEVPGRPRPPVARPRSTRPSPNDSRQYANPMATTAARDDRLTPQAKALLQVMRARAGKGYETSVTKGTLAAVLSRSTRSITRYLRDLERYGYIVTRIKADRRGFHLGLVVTITEKVLPFFTEAKGLARWLGESVFTRDFLPFSTATPGEGRGASSVKALTKGASIKVQGVTLLSSRNQSDKDSSLWDSNGQEEIGWARQIRRE
ncbi:helix-turn-helix domain-containing protein [Fulvimarina sp. MAC3]|uniref:helix-turn-helix domain-containing protein n=1 Tax=Fulvimarina sp. MAC3 TaxID=3148887 RepID=UPI0031FCDE17